MSWLNHGRLISSLNALKATKYIKNGLIIKNNSIKTNSTMFLTFSIILGESGQELK
jgi:hypothetical protein